VLCADFTIGPARADAATTVWSQVRLFEVVASENTYFI
jgi:hypothetical protein